MLFHLPQFWVATNNNNEAYNRRLDQRSDQHPNIWKFTELLQKEELHLSVKYEPIEAGTLKVRSRNGDDVRRDLAITTAKNTYLLRSCTFDDLEKLFCQSIG